MKTPRQTGFDCPPGRTDTDSLKWNRYAGRDILPLWVADMDFQSPPPVMEALHKRIDHGIFGYTLPSPAVTQAVVDWLKTRHCWTVRPEWIVWLPGIVSALHIVCRAFAQPEEEILTFPPIYPPFLTAPPLSQRRLVRCPLRREKNSYTIDLDSLKNAVSPRSRVLLLCSPHNPVGRVWTKEELRTAAQICIGKNCLICSDEIHADLVLDPAKRHIPTASLSEEIARHTVTLASPSKTFNLPGLSCAYAVIPSDQLRRQFKHTMQGILPHVNTLGYVACKAAYTEGTSWLNELLEYLRANRDLVDKTINALPGLSMGPVEATYLAWIDCRGLGIPNPALFFEEAGVGLSDGAEFDAPGFVRLNFACPRSRLREALARMTKALSETTL